MEKFTCEEHLICTDLLYIVIRSRRLRRIGHVSYMREIINAYGFFFWKIPHKRPEHR